MATKIKHVYGNIMRVAIPLTQKIRTLADGKETEVEKDFYPNADYPVEVVLKKGGSIHRKFTASVDGNVAIIVDDAKTAIGTYQVEVLAHDENGEPVRYMVRSIIEIVDATIDAGIEAGIEFNAETYTLDGAIYFYAKAKSSYDIWLEQGNVGSKEDFLKSLGVEVASEDNDGLLSADYFSFLKSLSETQIMDDNYAETLIQNILH